MLQKWKLILTNWINCYFKENNRKDLIINLETLLDIISHLRENLNSNSSLLDAHTVQEFIVEKYPDFKFENGSVEPESEEEVYLAASLLLFFVCLNSKNVDLKNAMCSKLSPGDQETILKFSKHLMECSKITHLDVQAAITEACGRDIATPEPANLRVTVAETPPALRSYHSEVRRLQAALDAERFDRTYLQEELTRTNLKVEKLLKDKEQYKLEIVDLKAQISQCCGQDKDTQGDDVGANNTNKLAKQLEDMELRLVNTQEQLEDVQYERDTYKSKLAQLKSEHDNLLTLSQQESTRANTLAEELEVERRQTQTLRDLVAELRQHNHLNRMDSSFLECDDPDASIHSLHHNSSACSEVCANVIEVQLGEERAKIVALKQQIQLLQEQLNEMSSKTEEEKQTLRQMVSEKESNIMDLKHRINEEIEEKNTLKAIFNDDVAKLNNELNELEQRLKGCQENSRQIIEKKMLEIQNMQEEKMSLLQSLSDETTKLESIIKDLQYEIDAEKSSKIRLREDYDNHIMKLNEKVLNRNNELVELQNKIVQKGEEVEHLQLQIRKERELKDQQLSKYNNDFIHLNLIREQTEQDLQKKTDEVVKLQTDLQQHLSVIEQINKESNQLKTIIGELQRDCEILKDTKEKLQIEIKNRDVKAEQIYKETENLKNMLYEEKQKLQTNLEETSATVNALQVQLQNEVQLKINAQDSLQKLQEEHSKVSEEVRQLNIEVQKLTLEKEENIILVNKLTEDLNEQIERNKGLEHDLSEANNKLEQLKQEILDKDIKYTTLEQQSSEWKIQKDAIEIELREEVGNLKKELNHKSELHNEVETILQEKINIWNEWKIQKDAIEIELREEVGNLKKELNHKSELHNEVETILQEKINICNETQVVVKDLNDQIDDLEKQLEDLEMEKSKYVTELEETKTKMDVNIQRENDIAAKLNLEIQHLKEAVESKKSEIMNLESLLMNEQQQNQQWRENQVKVDGELKTKEKEIEMLKTGIKTLQETLECKLKQRGDQMIQLRQENTARIHELSEQLHEEKEKCIRENESDLALLYELRQKMEYVMKEDENSINLLSNENELLKKSLADKESYVTSLENQSDQLKILKDTTETKLRDELQKVKNELIRKSEQYNEILSLLQDKAQVCNETQTIIKSLNDQITDLYKQKNDLEIEKNECVSKLNEINVKLEEQVQKDNKELAQLKHDYQNLMDLLEKKKTEIINLESLLTNEKQQWKQLQNSNRKEIQSLINKCEILQENQSKAEKELEQKQEKIDNLNTEMEQLHEVFEKNLKERNEQIDLLQKGKNKLSSHSNQLKEERDKLKKEIESKAEVVCELRQKMEDVMKNETESINLLTKENDLLKQTLSVKESYVSTLEKQSNELKMKIDEAETKLQNELEKFEKDHCNKSQQLNDLASVLQDKIQMYNQTQEEMKSLTNQINDFDRQRKSLEMEKNELTKQLEEMKRNHEAHIQLTDKELTQLKHDNKYLLDDLETKKKEIMKLQSLLNDEKQQNKQLQDDNNNEIQILNNNLQEYQAKTKKELESKEKEIETLNTEIKQLQEKTEKILQKKDDYITQMKKEKDTIINKLNKELNEQREKYLEETESKMAAVCELRNKLEDVMRSETDSIDLLTKENELLKKSLAVKESYVATLEKQSNEWKIQKDAAETELKDKLVKLEKELQANIEQNKNTECLLQEKVQICNETQSTVKALNDQIADLEKQKEELVSEKNEYLSKLEEMKEKVEVNAQKENNELSQLKHDNQQLLEVLESKKSEIINLESLLMYEKQQNQLLQDDNNGEKRNLTNKCSILQEYQSKAELELERRQKEIESLNSELKRLQQTSEKSMSERDELMAQMRKEKDELINKLSKELLEEREKCIRETELKSAAVYELRQKLEDVMKSETDSVKLLRKENELLKRTIAIKESFAVAGQEKSSLKSASQGADAREPQQVDNTSTDHSHSSLESYKTISDLEKILHDRNRTITSLQSDITYMKSLLAESEINLLDVTKDLEVSKENCQQLSSQLKKIVHQKNEEIADLKKQVAKMSVNENRASQIIKVSAKYQAIILKRIAEIKSNTVLKELTNFGNTANCDNDLRRSLTAGTVTMEDLENFLDTTDRLLRRCSEKQLALQKERDRLTEVNKINESEIINMKKFLTELSVSIKTFNSVKELYTQKLSRVISLQRTVKREILSLDGRITDATMCRLQRDYASVMQDLTECAMNLERWVERCLGRAISAEKIKQAFSTEERPSLAPTFQNASLEVQLEELENYFCKLLEEVSRAQKGDGAKDAQAVTVMEVRAEYEDKLNRMKAKMKQLYQEQIGIFKEKQREEIVSLEEELQKARDKLVESSRAYEQHIKALTTELWNVGEKFLMKKDEAEWLRKKQRHGSLMSLQHVHSSGLVPPQEEPSRPSDTHSLRSLPVGTDPSGNNNKKNEGRGLHMSDEEGEVFDNRCLRELAATPRRDPRRLSELQWRNSLCPPHLKSSYPAETQFVPAVHEDDIKLSVGGPSMSLGGRTQRKEVGITAYKKPGPPTPSKQAGRLSATDSELRESLRVEMEPNASRKTSTPSRIRALFRSSKAETVEGTPRSRRLSNIFRKK